jgi:hypothetical protein
VALGKGGRHIVEIPLQIGMRAAQLKLSSFSLRALDKLLGRLAAPRTDKPVTEITTAGRTGPRQGTVSGLTVDGKN